MLSWREIRGIVAGILMLVVLHVLFVVIVTPIATEIFEPKSQGNYLRGLASFIFTTASLGLSQVVYALPLGLWFRRRRRFAVMKGIVIGAVITFLLSGACFVIFFGPF
ncbi:MAG: hypothetical protein AAF703_02840 [Cyanobacteria bacterium P01_D01_bin.105]